MQNSEQATMSSIKNSSTAFPSAACPVVWSIAGSDSGGGAGIQADLRAFNLFGVHGCTAIAAVTAQNSVAVERIEAVSPQMLDVQLSALAKDLPPVAIKTGMLASAENVGVVAKWVDKLRADHPERHIALVVDPIRRASTGAELAGETLREAMLRELLPRATVVKPNQAEALWLVTGEDAGSAISAGVSVPELAQAIRALGAQSVVVTGGDVGGGVDDPLTPWADDWMDTPQACGWLGLPRVVSTTTHGTGCTFTASVTAAMALGFCAADAIILAKMATTSAVAHGYPAGAGAGTVCIAPDFTWQSDLIPFLRSSQSLVVQPFPALSDNWMGLYPVVESAEWVERVIKAGAKTVQLRIKSDDKRLEQAGFLAQEVKRSVACTQQAGVQFFVNDHWKLAIEHGAYGVHLGQEDLETADLDAIRAAGLRLGVSTHSIWQVCRARAVAPSYIACGPIHATLTKEMPWVPQGEGNLAYWCKVLREPVVAIAGLNEVRSREAVRCGAQGIAVVSAVTQAANPEQAIADLQQAISTGKELPSYPVPWLPHSTLPMA